MMRRRLALAREQLDKHRLDCLLITSYENYRYFSGFTGSNCTLLITKGECFALTDSRYDLQIREQAKLYTPIIANQSKNAHIFELISKNSITSIGYETSRLTDSEARALRQMSDKISWVPLPDFGEDIRAIKDASEILNIRRAAKVADDAFSALIHTLKKGMTEREVAARLEYEMALRGSEKAAFETIAASGVRGAMPHACPTDAPLPENGLLTLDFGACIGGYMSDITRTLHLGKPCRELSELWDMVYKVQKKCVAKVSPGITCREITEYQCELFSEFGAEEYIMHSLGHGVGLAIHEAPTVSKRSDSVLSENMVITIEPGLYIENLGGVRIEDTVLVTASGAEVLTHSQKRYDITLR